MSKYPALNWLENPNKISTYIYKNMSRHFFEKINYSASNEDSESERKKELTYQ